MPENTFVVIDVETANYDVSSICQIGAVKFTDGVIVDEWETLVNPETFFDYINTEIHGIEEFHVKNSPKFPEVYQKFKERYPGALLVTYTAFDRSSLNKAAIKYNLPFLENTWLDCAKVVRRHWSDFAYRGYGLKNIADHVGIKFKHHNALEDAKTAGLIFDMIMQESELTLDQWIEKASRKITNYHFSIKKEGNEDGPLFGECIVFTGALNIPRSEAAKIAADAGCNVNNGVNKDTTILVVGALDESKLACFTKSTKQRKAEQLIQSGKEIRILSEEDFYSLVELEKIS
jgi:DNA polymerase-3 subunit epsilon